MKNLFTHKGVQRNLHTRLFRKFLSNEAAKYNLKIRYNFSRNIPGLSPTPQIDLIGLTRRICLPKPYRAPVANLGTLLKKGLGFEGNTSGGGQ